MACVVGVVGRGGCQREEWGATRAVQGLCRACGTVEPTAPLTLPNIQTHRTTHTHTVYINTHHTQNTHKTHIPAGCIRRQARPPASACPTACSC